MGKWIELGDASAGLAEQARELYDNSFPHYERWGREAFSRAAADGRFRTRLLVGEDGELQALLYYWETGGFVYVEFIAVDPSMRGQSIGSRVIEDLIAANPGRTVLLEIDPPVDDISIRRLRFYERLGFHPNGYEHIHPSYVSGEGAHPHLLIVMSHGRSLTTSEFMEFRTFLMSMLEDYGD